MTGNGEPGFYRAGEGIEIEALPAEGGFYKVDDLPWFMPLDGVKMSVMAGARTMANWVKIDPGQTVPEHAHPHEQVGLVLEGLIDMTIDGDTRRLAVGDCYVIPGGVPHAATSGPEGCLVLDVFSPPREDYLAAVRDSNNE